MANYKKWVALSKFSSTLEKTTLDLVIEQKRSILTYIGAILICINTNSYFMPLTRSKYFVWSLVIFFTLICIVQFLGTVSFMLAMSCSIISSVFR